MNYSTEFLWIPVLAVAVLGFVGLSMLVVVLMSRGRREDTWVYVCPHCTFTSSGSNHLAMVQLAERHGATHEQVRNDHG